MAERYSVSVAFTLGGEDDEDIDVDAVTDALMDALIDIEKNDNRVADPAVGADLARRSVEVDLFVSGDGELDALAHHLMTVHRAMNSVSTGTAAWETLPRSLRFEAVHQLEPVD